MPRKDQELVFKSAQELAELIRKREVSPVEVVQAHLDRIDELNPDVNAFITVTREHALERAREAERDIRGNRYLGPLHGIPYGPKDILATKGILTTNASKVTADWTPDYESTVTQRLNQAGAILIGKVNLLEFAMGSGTLSGFGPSRNPWDLAYSPAGSSSGSGAALAARMLPLSIGTDTGGSIRAPAAANGVVGLKPTYGRVSRFGVTTLSWSLDHAGPMTRTVADNAAMLQVIAGHDPMDASSADEPVPDYSKALTGEVRGLKVGVPTNYFYEDASPEVEAAVRQAVKVLADRGAEIVDVEVPHAKYAGSAGWIIAMADGACFHEKRLKEHLELFDPLIRERLGAAKFYLATDYIKALRVRPILVEEMKNVFRKCDVMAVPGSNTVAGKLDPPEVARSDIKPGSEPAPYRPGNTFLGNMTGLPAMSMPCGFSAGPPKLPISIQFYARPFDEFTLFRVGHAYQTVTDWHEVRPPLTGADNGGGRKARPEGVGGGRRWTERLGNLPHRQGRRRPSAARGQTRRRGAQRRATPVRAIAGRFSPALLPSACAERLARCGSTRIRRSSRCWPVPRRRLPTRAPRHRYPAGRESERSFRRERRRETIAEICPRRVARRPGHRFQDRKVPPTACGISAPSDAIRRVCADVRLSFVLANAGVHCQSGNLHDLFPAQQGVRIDRRDSGGGGFGLRHGNAVSSSGWESRLGNSEPLAQYRGLQSWR